MILCDLLSYAVKELKPGSLIDIATLTGACVVALGDRFAGMMGTDRKAMQGLKKSGKRTGDLVWELPLHQDFSERMKSKYADFQNAAPGYGAGAETGACFLKFFVEKTPWVHIDIAGTAYALLEEPRKYDYPRGTGFGVRLLIDYLEQFGKEKNEQSME